MSNVSRTGITHFVQVVVDGPETSVPRQKLRLSQFHLTKFKINFPFNGSTKTVREAWKKAEMDEKWVKSRWAEKAANRQRVRNIQHIVLLMKLFYEFI